MREWLRANGGWPAVVLVGVALLGLTNRWAGYAFVALGLAGYAKQHLRPQMKLSEAVAPSAIAEPADPAAPEAVALASAEHRNAIRATLQGLLRPLQLGRPIVLDIDAANALRAHYPELVDILDDWNAKTARRIAAPRNLTHRIRTELGALELSSDFNVEVLATGFSDLTARRAATDQLGVELPRTQLWDVSHRTVRLRGMDDVAIKLAWNIRATEDGERERKYGPIAHVEPVLLAAQSWPEAQEIVQAEQAVKGFDSGALQAEIRRLVLPERIRVASGCSVCGTLG